MGNCLVTKLKESVNNDNLEVFGKLIIEVTPYDDSFCVSFNFGEELVEVKTSVSVNWKRYATSADYSATGVNTYTDTRCAVFGPKNTTFRIELDKYKIQEIGTYSEVSGVQGKIKLIGFNYFEGLQAINIKNVELEESIDLSLFSRVVDKTKLTAFIVSGDSCFGDISNLAGFSSLTNLVLDQSTKLTGDLSSMTAAQMFNTYFYSSPVTGDIAVFADRMVAAGRNSGTWSIGLGTLYSTFYGEQLIHSINSFAFGSSMVNPTQQDLERGWQCTTL